MEEEINVTGVSPEKKSEAIISGLAASQEERIDEKETEVAMAEVSVAGGQNVDSEGVDGSSAKSELSLFDEHERSDDCIVDNPFLKKAPLYWSPVLNQYNKNKKFHVDLSEWGMPEKVKDYLYEKLSELVSVCKGWEYDPETETEDHELDAKLLKVKQGDLQAARDIASSLWAASLLNEDECSFGYQGADILDSIGDYVYTGAFFCGFEGPGLFESELLARAGYGVGLVSLGKFYYHAGDVNLALDTLRLAQAEGMKGATDGLLEYLGAEYFRDPPHEETKIQEIISILQFLVSKNKMEYSTKLNFWEEEYNTRSHKREQEGGYIKP